MDWAFLQLIKTGGGVKRIREWDLPNFQTKFPTNMLSFYVWQAAVHDDDLIKSTQASPILSTKEQV